MTGASATGNGEAVVLRGVVDERVVERLGRAEVDLHEVTGWTPGGVRAMSSLLDVRGAVCVRPPRHASFLEPLRAADLGETWTLYRDVHRILAAARVAEGAEAG